jgi:hypothetical protein
VTPSNHRSAARVSGIGSLALLVALFGAAPTARAQDDVPIVYVRCARTTATLDVTGTVVVDGVSRTVTRTMTGLDIYDVLPDVTNFLGGFAAPCDLVLREASGAERVLYDCSTSSTDESSCAAMDPAVSFDGATVAFTVFRGALARGSENVHPRVLDPAATNADMVSVARPNRYLRTAGAQLHIVDVATGVVTALPTVDGAIDAGPAFLPDGRLAFTSTREESMTTLVWRSTGTGRGTRIWTMDLDGRNADIASHHSLSHEQHPFVLEDGRVAYSSWQIFGGLPFRHTNGSIGGFTTLGNLFHIYTQAPDGAHNFAFYGQHSGDHGPSTFGADHKAAHFLTQTSDGRVWFTDYYRGNNNGLGVLVGVMPEPAGQEGIGPDEATRLADLYAPRDAVRFARWASSADAMSAAMPAPPLLHPSYADPLPFAGKTGHPAALPDGGLMLVWGKGGCGTVTTNDIFGALGRTAPPHTSGSGQGTAMNLITSLAMDTPGCDTGIYRATVIPSAHPSDLEMIVDAEEWHEIMPRAVVPYAAIHGVERPMTIERADRATSRAELEVGTPFGLLGAASILDRETHPYGGIHFAGEHQFHLQGTDTIDYDDDDLCGVRILAVLPNRGRNTHEEIRSPAGERVAILGEIAVRNRDGSGAPRMDPSGSPDTSFLVRFPANVPYLMQGIDCEGRTLNTDQTWQSLRPGEMKTCGGCHVHSRASRIEFPDSFAASDAYVVPTLGEGEVPLLAGASATGEVATRRVPGYGLQVDFVRDVMPIFERRCASCHGGSAPAASLALDRPGVAGASADGATPASTFYCLVADGSQSCVPAAQRHPTGPDGRTALRRPQLTRYVRAFNALGSLLYWKAAGRRTDGLTDDTYTAASPEPDRDIDFGAAHTTEITPEELGMLSRWIDLGSAAGAMHLRDTQRPTLHLSAIVDGGAVTELRVGTVDVGAGIDPASLTVCVLGAEDACTDLSGDAELHGVAAIVPPSALSDPEVEVLARVADLAGNVTEVRRTVRWLLGAPPPPPERPDGGPMLARGDASTDRLDGGTGRPGSMISSGGGIEGSCACRAGARDRSPRGGLVMFAIAALAVARRARRRATLRSRS